MELWIRSQDKKDLVKATDVYIDGDNNGILVNGFEMAKYKTEERALEVLDEIQDMLRFFKAEGFSAEGLISIENNLAIYQMPKE